MRPLAILLAILLLLLSALGHGATIAELEAQLKAKPSPALRQALAEAYLHDCQLDRSLALWREVLRERPDEPRARLVVGRLSAQILDLNSHLDTLQTLVEQAPSAGVGELLEGAAKRAATRDQKARVHYLRGILRRNLGEDAAAQASLMTAFRLFPHTEWGARAAITLATMLLDPPEEEPKGAAPAAAVPVDVAPEVRRALMLLQAVADDEKLGATAPRELARVELVLAQTDTGAPENQTAALRDLLPRLRQPEARRRVLSALSERLVGLRKGWSPEAVQSLAAIFEAAPPEAEAIKVLGQLLDAARECREPATVAALVGALRRLKAPTAALAREASFALVEALLAQAVVATTARDVNQACGEASRLLDRLADGPLHRSRVAELRGRTLLVQAQKLAALEGPLAALPAVARARDHYLAALASDPSRHLATLMEIGRLLEAMGQWELAVGLYAQLAARYPHLAQGRDALLMVATVQERHLGDPLAALETLATYSARYPADLPYRQLAVGRRLRQLGYANILDFQKRNGLEPDGVFGPATRRKLEDLEETFGLIRLPSGPSRPLRGQFVHPRIFRIARRLEAEGHSREAVVAYRLFLNLFPTKREADDALLAIARIFARNLLFEEALGAYRELMEAFPKGDKTSEAYVEAARCLENLARWREARELYELYARKFPKYRHVALCRSRIALLDQIVQYADFIRDNPRSPKLPEAQYQIASILYKQFANHTKAAVEFVKVADRWPRHVRAADALYTAGVAQLYVENFPAARRLFARVVKDYPDSRLADDAQFWVGHSYEYAARALGRLDERRIVLRRRGLRSRAELLADLALRRIYNPEAKPGPEVPQEAWGGDTLGVLASGSKRDRVNADLCRAVRAYRQVVARFKMGDMAGKALLRIGTIYAKYLNDEEKAVAAFQELLENYPGSKEAVGALFEVGAYQMKKGNYQRAVQFYQKFAFNYPRDPRVEDAMAAIIRCHIATRAWEKALDACKSYLNRFPKGRHAAFASDQAAWIRTYHF